MRRKILICTLILSLILALSGCNHNSSGNSDWPPFSIHFLDVGQGDAALVQCDGHFMLIDGGDTSAGTKIKDFLMDKGIKKLDILAISHLHKDHFGGLIDGLDAIQKKIPLVICNKKSSSISPFLEFETRLAEMKSYIRVPEVGKTYKLGKATVEILDNSSEEENDSLVILISYKETSFLFTGDIGMKGQLRIADLFKNDKKHVEGDNLIKMPHHGAWNDNNDMYQDSALNTLLWQYEPEQIVISVGKGNQYKHPSDKTIQLLENYVERSKEWDWNQHVHMTMECGDIYVVSDGKTILKQ